MTHHIKKLMLAPDIIIKYGCSISHTKCNLCMQQFETINLNIFKASTNVVVNPFYFNNCNKKTNEKIKHITIHRNITCRNQAWMLTCNRLTLFAV